MENTKGNVVNENKKDIETISGSPRDTSGTIVNNFRTGYEVRIVWNVNLPQNVANNSSNVTIKVQFRSTGSQYHINSSATKNGSLTVNGTTYNFTFSAGISGGQTKTVFTKTVDIPHNSDGSKTCAMSTTLGINVTLSGTYWGNVSASGNAVFNAIPRTSSFSLNTTSGTIGSTQFVVNINRASNDFTHKVYYRFGSINWLGSSNATTSFSFTPSLSDCSQIPSATSGVGTIVVETWNGGTHIGTASQNITLYVPDSVKPSFSSLGSELIEAGASASYGYVKGKSKCKLSINGATGNQGSWITGYNISGGGFSSSDWQFTTGALTTAGNITFSAYVTDSRGRRSDTKSVTINVQDYTSPTIDLAMGYRCDSEGIPDENGTYIKVKFEHSIADNIPGNDWTNRVHYKSASSSTWIDAGSYASARGRVIGNGDISTNSTYNVRYTLSDKFETVTKIFDVAPSFVTIDFKRGGKGIAIGKISEVDNLFEVAMNTKLTGYSNCVTGENNTASTRVSDLNELWKSGFYDGDAMSNAPFSGWNWVIHAGHTNNRADYKFGMQIAGQNGSNNFAMRTVNVNGVGNWNTLYHTGNLPQHLKTMNWSADDLRWVGNQGQWNNGNKSTFGQLTGGTTLDGAYPYGAFAQFGGSNATGQIYLPENNASNEMYFRCSWNGNTNNGHWKRVWHSGNIGNPMPLWHKNSHWGMVANDNDSDWIRTTWNGIIPYQSGDCSSLGTDSWRFHYAHINTVQAHSGVYTQWLDDRVGASNWVCVDNANGGNSQITLRPEADNRGNLGHRNYTWNYANITSIGNSYSLRPTDAYSVSKFDNNDLMYDMVKNMNFYLEKEKSVEEFEEVLEIKESEEYQNADEDKQKEMIREVERKTPATYHYSKRMKLVANADELPFEVAPESHVADGSRTIETGAFMAGLASALQKAIEKIETLETKVESLEQEIELLKM